MNPIEAAILRTVLYADVFSFPMTAKEIHHFLIHDEPVSQRAIDDALADSGILSGIVEQIDGYVVCAGRASLIQVRQEREAASAKLWPLAVRYGRWLARLPFVRMVALTGALAVRNAANGDDDLDYILVTAPRRVWLARAFSILLVRAARLRGVQLCPNYVLAETALYQEQQNIFMAHEVAQMVPLYGCSLYQQFRAENSWVRDHLPNAHGTFYAEDEQQAGRIWILLKRGVEVLLGGVLGDRLEEWEYRRKLRRFAAEMQKPHSSARLDAEQVKGHFDDHGHPALQQYYARLEALGLRQEAAAAPGD